MLSVLDVTCWLHTFNWRIGEFSVADFKCKVVYVWNNQSTFFVCEIRPFIYLIGQITLFCFSSAWYTSNQKLQSHNFRTCSDISTEFEEGNLSLFLGSSSLFFHFNHIRNVSHKLSVPCSRNWIETHEVRTNLFRFWFWHIHEIAANI